LVFNARKAKTQEINSSFIEFSETLFCFRDSQSVGLGPREIEDGDREYPNRLRGYEGEKHKGHQGNFKP
jgi:hypothetical protein